MGVAATHVLQPVFDQFRQKAEVAYLQLCFRQPVAGLRLGMNEQNRARRQEIFMSVDFNASLSGNHVNQFPEIAAEENLREVAGRMGPAEDGKGESQFHRFPQPVFGDDFYIHGSPPFRRRSDLSSAAAG